MKPFNRKPECDKCTSTAIKREYHRVCPGLCGADMMAIREEHFKMHCKTCGYEWQEGVAVEEVPIPSGAPRYITTDMPEEDTDVENTDNSDSDDD